MEDYDDLFHAQNRDAEILEIIKLLDGKISDDIIKRNPYLRIRNKLRRRGELLYVVSNDDGYRLIIPKASVVGVLNNYHNKLSHLGTNKCSSIIKQRYYWPNMDDDILRYIQHCTICQATKEKNGRLKASFSMIKSKFPFEMLCIDIAGPFSCTKNNNRYILGMIDHFSKYVVLIPLKTVDAKTISRCIFVHWLTKFGMPRTIMSDNGRYFDSEIMNELCITCGLSQKFPPPYHQQSNGLIERLFKTAKALISATAIENNREWDESIPIVEMSLRTAVQKTTGVSPFEVIFGKPMILPPDIILEKPDSKTPKEYMKKVNFIKNKIFHKIRNSEVTPCQKIYFKPRTFNVGESVLIRKRVNNNALPIRKFCGPFEIVGKEGKWIYFVRDKRTGAMYRRHYDDLKVASENQHLPETNHKGRSTDKQYPLRNRI